MPPSRHAVGGAIGHLIAGLLSLDLVSRSRRRERELTADGYRALHTGLPARAIGPATWL